MSTFKSKLKGAATSKKLIGFAIGGVTIAAAVIAGVTASKLVVAGIAVKTAVGVATGLGTALVTENTVTTTVNIIDKKVQSIKLRKELIKQDAEDASSNNFKTA